MATYGNPDYGNWNAPPQNQQQSYNFEMPEQFGNELWVLQYYQSFATLINVFFRNFQSFETNQPVDPNAPNYTTNTTYSGSFYDPNAYAPPDPIYDGTGGVDFDNEPPLLEGKHDVNFCHESLFNLFAFFP